MTRWRGADANSVDGGVGDGEPGATRFVFDDCELDLERYELRRRGEPVHVEPQVFDVLVHLVRNRARLVTKNELLDAVWGDRFVSESALTSRLKAARRAVGDTGSEQRLIRTSFGRGYQFVGDVTELDTPAPTSRAVGSSPQSAADTALPTAIRFCTAPDGTRIAYAVTGEGPPLVKAANWMTHIDIDGANPVWRHWIEDLSAHHTLVRYDERGCGLSDWDVENFDFEDWIDDLRLVVNDAALDRFALLGVSQGAAVAIAFAARFPERVSHLVLLGSYGRGRLARATTDDQRREAALDLELARVGWSRDDPSFRRVFTSQFLPDGIARAVGGVRRAAAPHDLARERRALPRARSPPSTSPSWRRGSSARRCCCSPETICANRWNGRASWRR